MVALLGLLMYIINRSWEIVYRLGRLLSDELLPTPLVIKSAFG